MLDVKQVGLVFTSEIITDALFRHINNASNKALNVRAAFENLKGYYSPLSNFENGSGMKMTVYDDATTIGGNKIYVEENGRGVFLDFGMNFAKYGKYFAEFLNERSVSGIYDWAQLCPKLTTEPAAGCEAEG